jgi:hypothetical protein
VFDHTFEETVIASDNEKLTSFRRKEEKTINVPPRTIPEWSDNSGLRNRTTGPNRRPRRPSPAILTAYSLSRQATCSAESPTPGRRDGPTCPADQPSRRAQPTRRADATGRRDGPTSPADEPRRRDGPTAWRHQRA